MQFKLTSALRYGGTILTALSFAGVAHAGLIVDRGLPDENLNNAAGSDRSNVSWGWRLDQDFFAGDDFELAVPDVGNRWQIDRLRMWQVGGEETLGDRFDSISLFLGAESNSTINKVSEANLTGNATDNPDVSVNQVTYPGTSTDYQGSSGSFLNIWQIDFENLGVFSPGELQFAMGAVGPDEMYTFAHASNAALSGTPQEGSDDLYRAFWDNGSGTSLTFAGFLDSDGNGWDKSSDINIQVSARSVPEPLTLGLIAVGLLIMGIRFSGPQRRPVH